MNQSFLLALALSCLSVLVHAATSDLCAQFPDMAGCQIVDGPVKRKSAYMRFGRSAPDFDDSELAVAKRKSAYMRFGKRSVPANGEVAEFYESDESPAMIKRKSAYMRFGKRSAEPVFEFVPVELSEPSSLYMQKRKPASIRFG